MHRPRRVLDASWTRAQALAWQVRRRGNEIVVGHSGGTFGFSSCVAFSSREPIGVVVLSNGTAPASALALDLLGHALEAVRSIRPGAAVLPAPVPERYRALLGLYAWEDAGAWVRVEWRDGRLVLVWSEEDENMQTQVLEPTDDPLRFIVRGGTGGGRGLRLSPGLGRLDRGPHRPRLAAGPPPPGGPLSPAASSPGGDLPGLDAGWSRARRQLLPMPAAAGGWTGSGSGTLPLPLKGT